MLDFLAERRIDEAVSRGELDDLPGRRQAARSRRRHKALRKLSR
ncbi:MAG TPA: hypothetical protein VFC18_02615 [Burkholderiales bacterium]|nr:hypothetical protein [Burkholderiales bacterium]